MNKREILASEICEIIGAQIYGKDIKINSLTKVGMESQYNNLCTFCTNEHYLNLVLDNDNYKVIIISSNLYEKFKDGLKGIGQTFLLTDNPLKSFYYLHKYLFEKTNFYGEFDFTSKIGKASSIHESATITEGVIIGKNVLIGPNVVIHRGTIIGDNVAVEANTVIGVNGFEVANINNKRILVPHSGGTLINENSRIGSNVVICRSLFDGHTEIGEECQIDSLVNIAHNVKIGRQTTVVCGTCINGRAKIGDNVYIASGVIVLNRILIGDNAVINMGAVVSEPVGPNEVVAGFYAMSNSLWLKRMREQRKI